MFFFKIKLVLNILAGFTRHIKISTEAICMYHYVLKCPDCGDIVSLSRFINRLTSSVLFYYYYRVEVGGSRHLHSFSMSMCALS